MPCSGVCSEPRMAQAADENKSIIFFAGNSHHTFVVILSSILSCFVTRNSSKCPRSCLDCCMPCLSISGLEYSYCGRPESAFFLVMHNAAIERKYQRPNGRRNLQGCLGICSLPDTCRFEILIKAEAQPTSFAQYIFKLSSGRGK